MPITFTSFSPSTKIASAQVNANFTAIKTLLDSLRPQIQLYVADALYVVANVSAEVKIRTASTLYFSTVDLRVKTAPTGADVIVDINLNGNTIFSTRPKIVAGQTTGGTAAVFSTTQLVDGDVITIDVDQVGSTEPGRDLTIALAFSL